MANSPTTSQDLIEVARSRENFGEQPVIDLTLFEDSHGIEILTGHDGDKNEIQVEKKSFNQFFKINKRIIVAFLIVLALIFSLCYADVIFRGNKIAKGVSISGVNVGGKTITQAANTLDKNVKNALETPITLTLGNKSVSISSQDIGLIYETKKSVLKASKIGDSLNPLEVVPGTIKRYSVKEKINIEYKLNSKKYDLAVAKVVDRFSKGQANAGVKIDGTKVSIIKPKSGLGVTEKQVESAISASIVSFNDKKQSLNVEKVQAKISLEQANKTADILRKMFSADSVLTTPGGNTLAITASQLAQSIEVTPKDKVLKIGINNEKIRTLLASQLSAVEVAPVDASFSVNGTGVSVVPSVDGKQIDFTAALKLWIKGEHNFVAAIKNFSPKHDTGWAKSLNITEVVSSFTTNFTAGQERVKNIRRAAEVVNNTVLEPGVTFSLNNKLGRRTAENGYVKAPVFSDKDGFFEDFGGGASQFSTTLFNAAFIGGYKDITHSPHSIYISRYPMGREATLNYGSIDMAFNNDSKSGILIKTYVGATSVTVTLYGNKEGRKVTLEGPVEISRTEIETKYTDDPTLEVGKEKETQKGYPGIVVDNFRTVDRPGKPGKKERYRWTYNMVPRKVNRGTKPVAGQPSTTATPAT
ncbi:MAG: VanW family protein [Acidimicrobiia bacterium]